MPGIINPYYKALSITPCSLSGALSASGATATVTGTTRTVTVPSGNTGNLRFGEPFEATTGNMQYSKNGGAFTDIAAGTVLFANADTLAIRATTLTSPETDVCDIFDDDTGNLLESITITRT